jgi:hypothetical protein
VYLSHLYSSSNQDSVVSVEEEIYINKKDNTKTSPYKYAQLLFGKGTKGTKATSVEER